MEKDLDLNKNINNSNIIEFYDYESSLIKFTTDIFYQCLEDHKKDYLGNNKMGKFLQIINRNYFFKS